MQAWWDALDILGKVFAIVAIPSTLIMIIQTILMFVGIGDDSGIDADLDVDIPDDVSADGIFGDDIPGGTEIDASDISFDPGLKILTFRTIVAFFAVFGWVGLELQNRQIAAYITLPCAIISGVAIMFVMAWLIRELYKMQSNGNTDIKNALGMSGTAYIPIPAERNGKGKITVTFQNSTHELEAVTDESVDIPSYSEVLVVGITGKDTLVVKKK